MSKLFVIHYIPGPAWEADKRFFEQDLLGHGHYMKQLYDKGQLTHGGPLTDDTGGLSIFRAESIEEAQKLLAADPAIIDGVFQATVHPWFSVNWENYGD